MAKTKKTGKKDFMKSPAAFVVMVIVMLAMILAIVVFSGKKEAEIQQRKEEQAAENQPAATETPRPTSTPSTEEVIITEDGNEAVSVNAEGTYKNNKVYSISTGYGMTLYLGLEQEEATDALYLNPHFVYEYAGNPDEAYGYLLSTGRVPLEYSRTDPAPATTTEFMDTTDFAILGRTLDKVVPATCVDSQNYGVRWIDNPGIGGKANDGDTVHILVIRLSDGTLMGAAKAEIAYTQGDKSYRISSLSNTDVSNTGELTNEQRESLIQASFDFLMTGNDQMTFGVDQAELNRQKPFIIVERPGTPYYNKLYDKEANVISRGTLSICNVYAVNINCDGFGFFTFYYAPEPQAHGLKLEKMSEDEELKLVMVGYDAFAPMTVDIFNSFIFPDDVDKFGADKY